MSEEAGMETVHDKLIRGEVVPVGNKLHAVCRECRCLVRVDKPLVGDLHLCVPAGDNTGGEKWMRGWRWKHRI